MNTPGSNTSNPVISPGPPISAMPGPAQGLLQITCTKHGGLQDPGPPEEDTEEDAEAKRFAELKADVLRMSKKVEDLAQLADEACIASAKITDTDRNMVGFAQKVIDTLENLRKDLALPFVEAEVPRFDESSTVFYVLTKGRAPGIYSDELSPLNLFSQAWVQLLVEGLDDSQRKVTTVETLAGALSIWAGEVKDLAFTGRVPGDEATYGPIAFHIPPSAL
ncbi:hypothetical protein DFP72DRAFT_855752 [Ephemerocybe angulata]|uniref:Uncharacterized protein n=1 Tax=Ephemerocybe angulata TaxID=980116 RepID=A0A8H6HGW9_9AGAR|nr:hypothetical protein DFP72DRAFT_856636 [Tulosesus angulatus]KAF6746111.1 hypothetical protein DFP72DRAFT_855752 [Tulosesus angulatus]